MSTLAIDIGGTKFTMAVFDGDKIVWRESRATDREGGAQWMRQQLVCIGRQWQKEFHFDRCGIGFGGPVNFQTQAIALSTHVPGWSDFPLSAFVQDELSIPAVTDNDGFVGALGEYIYGVNRGCDPSFYMTISTGIGGGFVCGGKVLRGADSYANQIGHTPIRPDGPVCFCGAQGCLERYCGGMWLEKEYGKSARELLQDPAFLDRYVKDLAQGLKILIFLFNPVRIAIGGGISKMGDTLFVPLRKRVREIITDWSKARIDIVPTALGDDTVLHGANALAKGLGQ